MKIGIMADSHDNLPMIERAVEAFEAAGCEVVIHCGDFSAPFAVKQLTRFRGQVVGVFGNNDGEKAGIAKACPSIVEPPHVFEFGGRRMLAVHDIADAAEPAGVDVVVYGHSHEKSIAPGPPLTINPGETGGWLGHAPSVAVLDTESLAVELVDI